MSDLKLPYLNVVHLIGRLVHDPHKLTANGDRTGAAFTLAVNRYQKGKPTVSTFLDCICWGETAEVLLQFCRSGSSVYVTGALANYEKKNGATTTKILQVSVQSVQFLDKAPKPADGTTP